MEEENDVLSFSRDRVVHLLCITSLLEECVQGARLGAGGESRWPPASIEQVEREALKFSVCAGGAAWIRGFQEVKGQEKPPEGTRPSLV